MAHASVIRLHFSLSQRAYEGEVMESFSGSVIRGGAVPPYKGVRAVYDSLLGYESVNSQYGAPPSHAANMPVDPGTVFEGVAAGVAAASVDKCVNAAHEVVKIVGFLAPEDFTYLEPVVSVSLSKLRCGEPLITNFLIIILALLAARGTSLHS